MAKRVKTDPDLDQAVVELPPRPTNRSELAEWTQRVLGITIPGRSLCQGHQSPLDYLAASFLEDPSAGGDLLVWGNRGGGKTLLAAVASLLEGLYKAPIDVRILGGSFDQSDRLAEYLRGFLAGPLAGMVDGRQTRQRIRLRNGADIRMLAQSQRAVRGQHVQRMRCDEVDLFDAEVWRALQFVTHSAGGVRAAVEVFSTLHRSGGLMEELVAAAGQGKGYRLIRWCLWEVIERCPESRPCRNCPLAGDCRGRARQAEGFLSIDDAIAIQQRSSRSSWEAEMLCRGAKRDWLVFQEFDPARHVAKVKYCRDWPLFRAIDFGYTDPLVCLWLQVTPEGVVHVIDEYARTQRPIIQHAREILCRDQGKVSMTYVDPAGRQKESTTGAACTELLEEAGIPCVCRSSSIAEGLELVRAALDPAEGAGEDGDQGGGGVNGTPCGTAGATGPVVPAGAGVLYGPDGLPLPPARPMLPPRLLIDEHCRGLIAAFNTYHYPPPGGSGQGDKPVKDGPDHFIDALRYFFVNRKRPRPHANKTTY